MSKKIAIEATLKTFFGIKDKSRSNALVSVESGAKTIQEAATENGLTIDELEQLLKRYKMVIHHIDELILALSPALKPSILLALKERFTDGLTFDELAEKHGGFRNNYARVVTKLEKNHQEQIEKTHLYSTVFM
ncbi:hypothetical protein [Enterovibrio calviensis]|uniref:hypothetical protein n=1 Tax=Enterovibrio calviensis TaxID=91359 RepID=UPI003735B2D1